MIVEASIYVGNMSKSKCGALPGLSVDELKQYTGFTVTPTASGTAARRDDCLATWAIDVDETAPTFEGAAFVREDFIGVLMDMAAETA